MESYGRKALDAAASAAAVSAATSDPAWLVSILNAVRGVDMSSARSQQRWSLSPSPTCADQHRLSSSGLVGRESPLGL